MKIGKLNIAIVLLLVLPAAGLGQTDKNERPYYKNHITYNLSRWILREARVGYERNFNKNDVLRLTFGIQYPKHAKSFGPVGMTNIVYYYTVSHGIYYSVAYNYVFAPKHHYYISAELYNSFYYYNHKNYSNGSGMSMDLYESIQSMSLRKRGIKIFIGKKCDIFAKGKAGLQFDFYFGVGIQYYKRYITVYQEKNHGGYNWEPVNPPRTESLVGFLPTLNAGMLISVPFTESH